MRRIALGVASIVVVAFVSVSAAPVAAAVKCGTERWAVKTLSDNAASKVHYRARRTTVSALRNLPRPNVGSSSPRTRPVEFHTYKVKARVVVTAHEDDRDYHLVIAAPQHRRRTMIAEFPDTHCKGAAASIKRRAMARARRAFEAACGPIGTSFKQLHGVAMITGVGFWDSDHGQTGIAPNAVELHPVLKFRMVRGSCS